MRVIYIIKHFLEDDVLKWLVQPARERNKKEYRDHKFPDTDIDEVMNLVKEFQKATGKFNNVKIEKAGKNLFAIFADQNRI